MTCPNNPTYKWPECLPPTTLPPVTTTTVPVPTTTVPPPTTTVPVTTIPETTTTVSVTPPPVPTVVIPEPRPTPTTVAVVGTKPTFTLPETGSDLTAVIAGYALGAVLGGMVLLAWHKQAKEHRRRGR